MIVRRGPGIVLSLVLSAAAFVIAPSAVADDVGTAKDVDPCSIAATVKLRAITRDDGRIEVTGTVWSNDDNVWDWKFKHNGELSFDGSVVKAGDLVASIKVAPIVVSEAAVAAGEALAGSGRRAIVRVAPLRSMAFSKV